MADLDTTKATMPTILIGSDAVGNELTPVASDATGNLKVVDILNTAGQYRAQSVTTSAAEALGGAVILANRKMLSITPTNGIVYFGFDASVTTATGTPIFKNQTITFAAGPNLHVYVISAGTVNCRIAEAS